MLIYLRKLTTFTNDIANVLTKQRTRPQCRVLLYVLASFWMWRLAVSVDKREQVFDFLVEMSSVPICRKW